MNAADILKVDPRAEALIFDVDGTLVDSLPLHRRAWQETMHQFGLKLTEELFRECFGRTSVDLVDFLNHRLSDQLSQPLDAEQVGIAKDKAYLQYIPLLQPIGPVVDVVYRHMDRMPIGVATNESFGIANMVLRSTGLGTCFRALVTVDEVENPKPAPDIFLECAHRLGVKPESCQVFEDSDYGLEAARAAGMIVTDVRPAL